MQKILLGSCLTAALSCGGENAPPVVLRTDSLGVEIVAVPVLPGLDDTASAWTTSLVRIVASPPLDPALAPQLFDPQAGVELESGYIIVRDNGPQRLVVFHNDSVVARFAPPGSGPGEVSATSSIVAARSDRTFYLVELWGNRRIHHFTVEGKLLSDVRLERGGGWPASVGRTEDELTINVWSAGPGGLMIDSVARVNLETGAVDPFGRLAPRDPVTGGRPPLQNPYGLWSAFADGRYVAGRTDNSAFRVYSEKGVLEREIRLPLSLRILTEADQADIIARAALNGLPVSREGPAFNSHWRLASRLETVNDSVFALVHRGRLSGSADPVLSDDQEVWRLISVTGEPRGTLMFPVGFSPWTVRNGRVLGAQHDTLGMATVELRSLIPPRSAPEER